MSFLKTALHIFTDRRDIKEPIVVKDFNNRDDFLANLKNLANNNDPRIDKQKVENHYKLFSIGQAGEKAVFYELKNSMLPIVILHDVNIEIEDYKAQIDFVIVSHKFILILEVKKLIGNIKVTEDGEFQRIYKYKKRTYKEGMYSPINQAERHASILEKLLKEKGVITRCPVRYAVTFANPKTILDVSKKAPKEIKSKIIRHDQIKSFLSEELKKDSPVMMLDKRLFNISDTIVQFNREQSFSIENYLIENEPVIENTTDNFSLQTETSMTNMLEEKLKEYRLQKSRELGIRPFYIFTNKTLEDLITKRPSSIQELLKVDGIGQKKAEDYGNDILEIFKAARNSNM